MEVFRDDSWEKLPVLPEDYGFIEIAYELEPGESRFMDIDFEEIPDPGKPPALRLSECRVNLL